MPVRYFPDYFDLRKILLASGNGLGDFDGEMSGRASDVSLRSGSVGGPGTSLGHPALAVLPRSGLSLSKKALIDYNIRVLATALNYLFINATGSAAPLATLHT